MRRTLTHALCALFILGGAAGQAAAADLVLRFHHMLPADATIVREAMIPWAKAVEAQSGGRIAIEFHHAMQLGGRPADIDDQIRRGDVELGWTVLGYTEGRYPKSEAFELPFMTASAETGSVAFQAFYEAALADEFRDLHVIAVHIHGPGIIHARDGVAIQRLEDLAGLKVRGASRMVNAFLDAAGAVPVMTSVTAVPEALRTGLVEAAVMPWEVVPAVKTEGLAPVHTEFSGPTGFYTATFMLAMNKATYERLPADLKAAIDSQSGEATARLFGRAMDDGDRTGRQAAIAAGHDIITVSEAETARFRALGETVTAGWIAAMTARGLDGAGLVQQAKSIIAARQTQ